MTALKIVGILVSAFLLAGFLRLGAVVTFGDGVRVRLRVGAFTFRFPRRGKKAGREPKDGKEARAPESKKKRKPPTLSSGELRDLLAVAFTALGATARRACGRTRIDPLELTAVFGGGDPADAAVRYGAASALMYTLMPRAEELFYIPSPSLHLRPGFDREGTDAEGAVGVSLRVCDLFAVAWTLALPLAKWYLRVKRARRRAASAGARADMAHGGKRRAEKQIAWKG